MGGGGEPRETWRRMIEKEMGEVSKACNELKYSPRADINGGNLSVSMLYTEVRRRSHCGGICKLSRVI